jgi:hypothetical protein
MKSEFEKICKYLPLLYLIKNTQCNASSDYILKALTLYVESCLWNELII